MKPIQGYHLIAPKDLAWRPSNLMQIPNADYLERTGSENMGARLWRLPPRSANTLHKHVRSEEFYFVVAGTGRLRVGSTTLTVPRHGGVWVGPEILRQVFNDTESEVLWLIIGAPEELEFLSGSKSKIDLSAFYPTDPRQLPDELAGVTWPPKDGAPLTSRASSPTVDFVHHTHEWLAAWNAHDLERILAHYADAVEFHSPFVTKLTGRADGIVHGKPALRDYFSRALAAYPTLKFEFLQLYSGTSSCVLEYQSVDQRRAAEHMELDSAGKGVPGTSALFAGVRRHSTDSQSATGLSTDRDVNLGSDTHHLRDPILLMKTSRDMIPVVVITGASGGIGSATAILAASRGFKVCVHYHRNQEAASALVRRLIQAGAAAIAVRADIAVRNEVRRLFKIVDRDLGPLSALVNNAGTLERQCRVAAIDPGRLQRIFSTNVFRRFLLRQGSHSSHVDQVGRPGRSHRQHFVRSRRFRRSQRIRRLCGLERRA